PEETLLDVLDEVLASGLVREAPGAGEVYQFAHAIVRQALYGQVNVSRRLRLHRQVGETMEQLYAANLEPHLPALSHHFYEAAGTGEATKAVRYCRMAGDQALAQLAYGEAAAYYTRAVEALRLGSASAPAEEAALLLRLGDARARMGDRAGMKAAFARAA